VNERARARALLRRIERESLFASYVVAGESGFVRTLVLGVLRWRSRLDFVIETLAKRSIEPEILDVLRLGAYQLLHMDIAHYAAVGETVDLAPKRARGFVNAILRHISRGDIPEPRDVATRTAHPAWLIERWTRFYGAERAAKIADANQELSYPDVLALTNEAPPDATPSTLADHVYRLHGSSAGLDRTKFWPMDEGSAMIASIAATLGNPVLDLAAAPGGKTLYMRRAGARVVSNDISLARLLPLAKRGGSLVVSDARQPPFRDQLDVVLLDAPCSATGTIRKNPEIKWRLRENDLATFAAKQRDMIAAALSLAKKYVVYSTCSLEPEENDDVVASTGARIVPIDRTWTANGVLRLTPESGADGFTAHVLAV